MWLEACFCGRSSTTSSSLGLFGRVLQFFLFLADFITKDRTTLSGFAFTPPLLESMNMKLVGRLDCLLGAGRPVKSLPSCLSCASIWCWCHPATVVPWICGCKDGTWSERSEYRKVKCSGSMMLKRKFIVGWECSLTRRLGTR